MTTTPWAYNSNSIIRIGLDCSIQIAKVNAEHIDFLRRHPAHSTAVMNYSIALVKYNLIQIIIFKLKEHPNLPVATDEDIVPLAQALASHMIASAISAPSVYAAIESHVEAILSITPQVVYNQGLVLTSAHDYVPESLNPQQQFAAAVAASLAPVEIATGPAPAIGIEKNISGSASTSDITLAGALDL